MGILRDYQLDKRVKLGKPNEFRAFLALEDIKDEYRNIRNVEGYIGDSEEYTKYEDILDFYDNPITVPNVSYLFYKKIWGINSELLQRAVQDLTYLNPNIDSKGLKEMSKYLLRVFAKIHEGVIQISLEDLYGKVLEIHSKLDLTNIDIVETNKVVLFKRGSLFSTKTKRSWSNFYRTKRTVKLSEELIHNVAIYSVENTHKYLKISNTILLDNMKGYADEVKRIENKDIKVIKSKTKLLSNISEKTKMYLKDENKLRDFPTVKTLEKYLKFIELMEMNNKASLDSYSEMLKISKGTAKLFKELYNSDNSTEINQ